MYSKCVCVYVYIYIYIYISNFFLLQVDAILIGENKHSFIKVDYFKHEKLSL